MLLRDTDGQLIDVDLSAVEEDDTLLDEFNVATLKGTDAPEGVLFARLMAWYLDLEADDETKLVKQTI